MPTSGATAPLNPRTVLSRCIEEIRSLFNMWHKAGQVIRPSVKALREYCARQLRRDGIGRSTILRALKTLYGSFVNVQRRYRRSSVYTIIEDAQMSFSFDVEAGAPKAPETVVETAVVKPVERQCFKNVTDISRFERHQHRDAVETATEETVRKSAGIERLSEGDRVFIRDLERSGVPAEVIRGGVFLGRARRMVSESRGRVSGAIRSVRYFAESITEAAKHPIGYLEHVERFVVRNQKKSA